MTAPLILHGGALGDLVLTIQFARRLPAFASAGRIELVSRADPGDLTGGARVIRRRSLELLGAAWLYGDAAAAAPRPLTELVVGRSVLSALGGAGSCIHRQLSALSPASLLSLDPRPVEGSPLHITEQWARQVIAQGGSVARLSSNDPNAGIAPGTTALPRPTATALPTVLIHPGSGGREKCWPLAGFMQLGRLCLDLGHRVAFVLGEVEHERWSPEQLRSVRSSFTTVDRPAPDDLAAMLASAHVFVGNDAGPTHLAALLGTPVLALFGPTDPDVWRPLASFVRILRGDPKVVGGLWGLAPAHIAAAITHIIAAGGPGA